MANTYVQLYVHYVFVVKNRSSLISPLWSENLYKYINGIVAEQGHKLYVINGMPDHLHALVSMSPKQSPSDLMYHVKRSASIWINDNMLVPGKFSWQEGFGAFTVGKAQLEAKIRYIENQQTHHAKASFKEEYLKLLAEHEVVFDERFIFESIDCDLPT